MLRPFHNLMRAPFHRWLPPAAICLLLGLLLALQLKTQARVREAAPQPRVTEELVAQFLQVSKERDRLLAERDQLQEAVSRHAVEARLRQELSMGLAGAGLVPVSGQGVVVQLSDLGPSPPTSRQVDPADVLLVINELRAAGAEALAVAGQRVTPRLAVGRAPGPKASLMVGDVRVEGAVRIAAVGDPELLLSSLTMRGGVVQRLTPWMQVQIQVYSDLLIPMIDSPPAMLHSKPAR